MAIEVLVLGAGQEVGKSCVVVSIDGKRIMFDCGMHMAYNDRRRFPDFSLISPSGDFNNSIDCVVITHFHLDHIGALPYFTEVCGYSGPVYMTHPTKAMAPLMLEDYRRVIVDKRGEEEMFSSENIEKCFNKVIPINLRETLKVKECISLRPYYAGHVLGAAMFYAKVGDSEVLYTGDYNMTPDRHLGAAEIDKLSLDLVITESTYATTIRDFRYFREIEFLEAVHKCVSSGGKVLIPSFAVGRVQELLLLLDEYWDRLNLDIPIYISSALTIKANTLYEKFIGWTNQRVKDSYFSGNGLHFRNAKEFDSSLLASSGPCVLFASPGMITGGFSFEVFKLWAPFEKNLIALPGYCVPGTVGQKLLSCKKGKILCDEDTEIDVHCKVHQMSFSPHSDGKGIMDLIHFLSPKHVILVHGEAPNMHRLKLQIESELSIKCHVPANSETVAVPSTQYATLHVSVPVSRTLATPNFRFSSQNGSVSVSDNRLSDCVLVAQNGQKPRALHQDELPQVLGKERHFVKFAYCFPIQIVHPEVGSLLKLIYYEIVTKLPNFEVLQFGDNLYVNSFRLSVCTNENCFNRFSTATVVGQSFPFVCCSWCKEDGDLASTLISVLSIGKM